jgi:arabinogalactan oligomer/maltooligosaccharide transport system permease protein
MDTKKPSRSVRWPWRGLGPRHSSPLSLILTHLLLIASCAVFLFPLYQVVKVSLESSGAMLSTDFHLLPRDITFENYAKVFGDPRFARSVLNSFIYAGGTTLVSLIVAVSAAYAYSRMRFRGRKTTLWAMILLQAFPGIATVVPMYIIFSRLSLIDTYLGLIVAYTAGTLPFSIWMMKSFFDSIPKEIEEAALVDGATINQAFLRVVLPLSLPGIAITALFGFISGWTEFILAITFINSEELQPLSVVLYGIIGRNTTEWSYFAAESIIFALPVVFCFLFFQRYLIGGLTVGSVKG